MSASGSVASKNLSACGSDTTHCLSRCAGKHLIGERRRHLGHAARAARNNYQVFEQGTRILKRTESGERVFLEENEIAAEKQKARAEMDEACKKT